MGILDGQVAIVTGAGRGLGREHALLLAREGARVIVNDLGSGAAGDGHDAGPAEAVVNEIIAFGGEAIANVDDVSDWEGARRLINTAIDTFGELDVLVNNAGIVRDRTLVKMSETEWDDVVAVHLKGTFCPTHWAATFWRDKAKAVGAPIRAAIVNTSSGSGLHGNAGQVNYAAAKAGIAAITMVAAKELAPYGVRVNAIAPFARTRMSEGSPALAHLVRPPADADVFDIWHPANISPLVGYLSSPLCEFSGQVFAVVGQRIGMYQGWSIHDQVETDNRWTMPELAAAMKTLPVEVPTQSTLL